MARKPGSTRARAVAPVRVHAASPPGFLFQPVRTRVLKELIEAGPQGPKVLSIVAPIGYGKTVLMSELHGALQGTQACYWIGLDDRDTTLERVIRAIDAALSGRDSELHPSHALLHGDEPVATRIDALLEVIGGVTTAATVFIDNLNSCTDEALAALCDALVFRTPDHVRFVWSTTTDIPIALGRAKLEGRIRQIGHAELSLNAAETRALLGAEIEEHIGAIGVRAILQQTEGWPAAIRMAQIVLAGAERPRAALEAFSGSDEDVAALLNRQVLKGFTPKLRDFLLCLGQLRNFTPELCRAAIDKAGAERHLDVLLRRNVFLIPLDRNRKSYRLHGLFREFLLSEAERFLDPARKREVLKRAAAWCEQHEVWRDAVDYALAAGEMDAASRILDRTARMFVRDRGDIELYIRWVNALEAAGAELGWESHFWYVWALIFHRHYESGRVEHERLVKRLRSAAKRGLPPDLAQRIDYLRICLDILTDRIDDTLRRIDDWLRVDRSDDPYNIGSVHGLKAIALATSFRFAQAREALTVAERVFHETDGAYTRGWVSKTHGSISLYEGDYLRAQRELGAGLARAREELGEEAVLADTLAFVNAFAAVEMGRDDEARELVRLGLRNAYGHGLVDVVACGFDAAVKLWQGSSDELISIPRLREVARSHPPRLGLMLSCFLVRRLLHLGRLKEALVEAQAVGLGADGARGPLPDATQMMQPRFRDLHAATALDLLMAATRYREADALIEQEIALARHDGRMARLVELGLARMTIYLQVGDVRHATKELSQAVSRAAPRSIVRPFRDQAAAIATLVNDTKPSAWAFALGEERTFFHQLCERLPIDNPVASQRIAAWSPDDAGAVVPTAREAELLALIDQGLSNQQIADHTGAAVGTIKWHLKNLFRKFGVSNRSAALARARAMGLLPTSRF